MNILLRPAKISDISNILMLEGQTQFDKYSQDSLTQMFNLDYYKIIIEPQGRHASIPHANVDKEYIVVLEGTLEMTVNDQVFTLHEGQAFSFNGNAGHCYANPSNQPVVFHNVIRYK